MQYKTHIAVAVLTAVIIVLGFWAYKGWRLTQILDTQGRVISQHEQAIQQIIDLISQAQGQK